MKIAFVIKSINTKGGGAEKVLTTVINNIIMNERSERIIINLYTLDEVINPFYEIKYPIKIFAMGGRPSLLYKINHYLKLIYSILKFNPKYVVAFNLSSYIPCAIIPVLNYKIKLIASEHSTYQAIGKNIIKKLLLYFSHFSVSKYTILSKNVCSTFPNYIQKKAIIIPNPVIIPENKINKSAIYNTENFNVISVGRLVVEKNQILLIKAFSQVVKANVKAKLYIFGDGVLRDILIKEIQRLNLSESIFIFSSINDINQIYKGADLLCFPSLYEGFGLAAAEALSYKIPVIGFNDCIGLKELIISNYNGLLLERNEHADKCIANAIEHYINNPIEYARTKNNCILPIKYSEDNVMKLWLKMFLEI